MTTAAGLLDDLEARGLVHDTTDRQALAERLSAGPVTLYYGCDPTADSLHVGNLIGLLVLRRFQDAGHRPVALAGGATGMVGDPSGRSDERNLLDEATLSANVAAIKAQMARLVDFDDGRAVLVDNREWTVGVTLLDFLRDVGKHVTVNQMLARESVKARLAGELGISYTEFSYMLLQAHDYLHLHARPRRRAADRRVRPVGQHPVGHRPGSPGRRGRGPRVVVAAADGARRHEAGQDDRGPHLARPARTTPYQFFQHWMQTDDRQVGEYLRQVHAAVAGPRWTRSPSAHLEQPERRAGQRRLARRGHAVGARRGGRHGGRPRHRGAVRRLAPRGARRGAGGRGGRGADRAAPG